MTISRNPLTSSGSFFWIDIPAVEPGEFGGIRLSWGTRETTSLRLRTYTGITLSAGRSAMPGSYDPCAAPARDSGRALRTGRFRTQLRHFGHVRGVISPEPSETLRTALS